MVDGPARVGCVVCCPTRAHTTATNKHAQPPPQLPPPHTHTSTHSLHPASHRSATHLVQLHPHRARHKLLRAVDGVLQREALGGEPEAVVHQLRVLGHEVILRYMGAAQALQGVRERSMDCCWSTSRTFLAGGWCGNQQVEKAVDADDPWRQQPRRSVTTHPHTAPPLPARPIPP